MKKPRKILIILPWFLGLSREICRGIYSYNRTGTGWEFILQPYSATELYNTRDWKYDGIIGGFNVKSLHDAAIATGHPVIDVSGGIEWPDMPQVCEDNRAIGRLAAQHLMKYGLKEFAFFGADYPGAEGSKYRGEGFVATLKALGLPVAVFSETHHEISREDNWQPDIIAKWIKTLPSPVGLFVSDDTRALVVGEACRRANRRIPEDIAILSVEDDEVKCEGAAPPLSSIRIPFNLIGFEAARMLDLLMRGKKLPAHSIRLPPESVIERQSTDIMAVDDPHVAAAVRYIRDHISEQISNEQLALAVGLSQRVLEKRFHGMFSRSPQKEIRHVRIERACYLLRDTNLDVEAIAERCGFATGNYMGEVFRKAIRISPANYRRQYRPQPA